MRSGIFSPEERPVLVEELFKALAAKGAVLVSDIKLDDLRSILAALSRSKLVGKHWHPEGMRESILLSIILLALCIILVIKEQATLIFGNAVFGVLCLVEAYLAWEKAARSGDDPYRRFLYIGECIITGVPGFSVFLR